MISRHPLLIEVGRALQCSVGNDSKLRMRRQVDASLSTAPGAPTPGRWRLCINHTRVGGTAESKAPTGAKGVRFKQKVLRLSLDRVAASASTPGLVVGDLNLTRQQVQEVTDVAAPAAHNVRFHGGEGQAASVKCFLPCFLPCLLPSCACIGDDRSPPRFAACQVKILFSES